MADKILNTRIINKHDDLATWKNSSLPLKTGEIALARIETTKPDGHGGFYTVPTYLMKVGDGNKTFSQLEWLAAPASDVYEWAKASVKPSYNAGEITRGSSTVATDLKAAEDAISALQTAIGGSGSVATMIQEAINALDNNDAAVDHQFVTAAVQTDGTVAVTRRALTADDIPALEIAKITGLQTALDAKAATTYVDEKDNAIKATIGSSSDTAGTETVYGAIATAKAAGDKASSDLAEYKTANDARVKAIADDYTTAAQAGTIAQGKVDALTNGQVKTNTEAIAANSIAISEEVARAEGVEGGLDTRLKAAEDAITSLNAATTLEGVGTLAQRPASGKVAGAIWVATDNNKEYIWDGTAWVELGDTTAELNAINSLDERLDAVEADLSETGDTTKAIAAAKAQADKGVADAKTANDAIAVINGNGEGSIAKAVADEAALRTAADTAINEKIGGSFTKENTVAKAITAAADAASAAQTAIDEHKSAANAHTKAQVGLDKVDNKSVAEIKTEFTGSVADNNTGFVTGDAVYDAIEAAKTAAATTAQGKVDALANGAVKTNTQNIANNATDISTIKNNYVRVEGDALVYSQTDVGDGVMTIIFDCGGAE